MKHLKTYESSTPVESEDELKNKLKSTIECAEKYKKSYFWRVSNSASSRRSNEIYFSKQYPDYTFEYKGNKYEVNYEYTESGSHVYFSLDIYKNDIKTNLTTLKTIYKKLSELENNMNKYNL